MANNVLHPDFKYTHRNRKVLIIHGRCITVKTKHGPVISQKPPQCNHACKHTVVHYVQPTLLVSTSFLKPKKLLHLQVSWRDLAVNKAVGIFLLRTLQLLAVLIDVFQDPAAVGRRQLEPHL